MTSWGPLAHYFHGEWNKIIKIITINLENLFRYCRAAGRGTTRSRSRRNTTIRNNNIHLLIIIYYKRNSLSPSIGNSKFIYLFTIYQTVFCIIAVSYL